MSGKLNIVPQADIYFVFTAYNRRPCHMELAKNGLAQLENIPQKDFKSEQVQLSLMTVFDWSIKNPTMDGIYYYLLYSCFQLSLNLLCRNVAPEILHSVACVL